MTDRQPNDESCGCEADDARAERDPAYRKALWVVASMNLGFGVVEMMGGFIANSQALKADALDFLGDGSITFVALLALAWTAASRARVALAQGISLLVLVSGLSAWQSGARSTPCRLRRSSWAGSASLHC